MFQRDLGRATALVDTAESALEQVAATWTTQAHDAAEGGIETTDEQQRRLLMICQQNVELCPPTPICPRRPASTVHGHLAARAPESAI